MIFLRVRKSWSLVRGMPLFRALVLDGAIYYTVFILAFSLDIIASTNSEVGVLHLCRVLIVPYPSDTASLSHREHQVCTLLCDPTSS